MCLQSLAVLTLVYPVPRDERRKRSYKLHELSLVNSIYDIIIEKIGEYNVSKVTQVKLVIGELAGIEDLVLRSCFEMFVQATPIEGAELVIEHVPVKLRCRKCGNEYEADIPFTKCPLCRKDDYEIIGGKEFYISSLQVE